MTRAIRYPDRRPQVALTAVAGFLGVAAVALALRHASPTPDLGVPDHRSMPGVLASLGESIRLTAVALEDHFNEIGYSLERINTEGGGVPRLRLSRLPGDLPQMESPDQRKTFFIKMLLPLLLAENERILGDRERLLTLLRWNDGANPLSADESGWLASLAQRYRVRTGDVEELVRRVDVVPPSLALAQAALESGWGTSRPAQHGQALFGQFASRSEGDDIFSHLRRFDHLAAAIEAYASNLNTHRAYRQFRGRRAELRRKGTRIDGHDLASYIVAYSERRLDYIRDVRLIIRANNLQALDAARFRG
jgi:Bax protein